MSDQNKKVIYLLFVIIILGLIVRFWGINYGLPEIMYIDAQKTVGISKRIAFKILNGKFDIDPEKYQYPTFFINILAAEFVLYGVCYGIINTHSGRYKTFKEAIHALYTPKEPGYIYYRAVPHEFYLLARMTSALAGTITIFFVFLLGSIAFKDRRIGLVAALFLAFMFGHVKDAQYPMTDATMCLMGTIGLYYLAKISIDDRLKDHIFAGAFLGLGISTKYFPVFFIIPYSILVAKKIYERIKAGEFNFDSYKRPLIGFLMIFIFFLVGTPIFITRYNKYLGIGTGGVTTELKSQTSGKIGYTQGWYFDLLFSKFPINNEPLAAQSHLSVLGSLLLILLIFGILYSVYRVFTNTSKNRWIDIGFTLTVILFYIFMAGEGKKKLIRYFYFLYPVYAVIAARFLTESIDFLFKKKKHDLILAIASIIIIMPTGIRTVRFNYLRSHTDTRLIAGKWFEQNIPAGSKVLTPILYHPIISSLKFDIEYYRGEVMENFNPTVGLFRKLGFDYIITSSYDTIVFYSPDSIKMNPELTMKWRNFFDSLNREAQLVKRFESNTFNKPGPEIRIYKIT